MLLEDRELHARVLSIGPHRSDRDMLHVVDEIGARAGAAQAVLGSVACALGLGKAGVTAEAGVGLGSDAPHALHQPNDHGVTLDGERVVVVAPHLVDAAAARGRVEGGVGGEAAAAAAEGGDAVVLLRAAKAIAVRLW